jgi:hypothetical protein
MTLFQMEPVDFSSHFWVEIVSIRHDGFAGLIRHGNGKREIGGIL